MELAIAGSRAAIAPAAGFNCFHWQIDHAGASFDLLYRDPSFPNSPPTRSGIPVLFPFPNRIRDGQFAWASKAYQLPLNDPAQENAIHGFACRRPWRVVDQGADATSAWVTGEFWAAHDAPDVLPFWPADHRLRLTYRLCAGSLRLEARVDNPDRVPLPFGLGYHPYFHVTGATNVEAMARQIWELVDNLPTGRRKAVAGAQDLRQPRAFADLKLDDVLADLEPRTEPRAEGLLFRGAIAYESRAVHILTSQSFRELVAFTPPHRQAVCLEPYTCVTDAVNLSNQGYDTGWLVLEPGALWHGVVEFQTHHRGHRKA